MEKREILVAFHSGLYRGVKLENKTIWDESSRILTEDIWCRVGYGDLPLYYRRYFRNEKFYLSAGLSLSLAVQDASFSKRLGERIVSGYPGKHDYGVNIDPGLAYILNSSSIDYMFGGGWRTKRLGIALMVRISTGRVETISGDIGNINSEFVTFSLLGSWYF